MYPIIRVDCFLLLGCNNNDDECVDFDDQISFLVNTNLVASFNLLSLENQTNKWIDKSFEFIPNDILITLRIEFKRSQHFEKYIVFGVDDILITSVVLSFIYFVCKILKNILFNKKKAKK